MRRALLVIAVLLLAGCEGGPTEPNRTQVLTGTLARAGSSVSTVSMRSTGNMRVTALDLEAVAADGTAPRPRGITFATGEARSTAARSPATWAARGHGALAGLIRGDYCLKLSEPEGGRGSSLRYSVELAITD